MVGDSVPFPVVWHVERDGFLLVLDGILAHELGQFIGSRIGIAIGDEIEIIEDILWGQGNQRIIGKHGRCIGRVVAEVPMVSVRHEAAQVRVVVILLPRHGGYINIIN